MKKMKVGACAKNVKRKTAKIFLYVEPLWEEEEKARYLEDAVREGIDGGIRLCHV